MRSLNIALTRRFISAALIITALGTLSGCQLKENFDGVTPPALPFGWTTSGTNGAWVTVANTTPDRPSDSGANSAFVAAANNQDVSLVTPSMSIPSSGAAQLSFKHRCKTEPNFDGGILEISQNGGGFQNITAVGTFLTGAYTGPLNTAPFGVSPAWNNEQNYVSSTVSLNVTEGSTLKLRFRSVSDNTVQGTGCSVDTVSLDGADLVVTKTDSKDPVLLDGNFVYTITVRNNGALNASNVLLYDVLPLGFQYVSTSLSQGSMLVSTPPVLYASLGNISSGAQAVMTVTGTAPNAAPHAPALAVTSPSTLTRTMIAGDAAFGPALNQTGVGGEVILANDGSGDSEDACQNLAPNFAAGKVLLVRQSGVCSFNQQTKTAQNAGAVGVVVYSNSSEGVIAMGSSGLAVNIPALFIGNTDGNYLKSNISNAIAVSLRSYPNSILNEARATSSQFDPDPRTNFAAEFTVVGADSDGDGTVDPADGCFADPHKIAPGACGCGIADTDSNSNGIADCLATPELKSRAEALKAALTSFKLLRSGASKSQIAAHKQARTKLKQALAAVTSFIKSSGVNVVFVNTTVTVQQHNTRIKQAVNATLNATLKEDGSFGPNKRAAVSKVKALIAAIG